MTSQADQFNAELAGSGSLVDREYSRLLTKTGQPAGRFSLRDLYILASEEPRLILGRYSPVGGGPTPGLTYIGNSQIPNADAAVHTLTNASLGIVDAKALTVLVITWRHNVTAVRSFTSVTVAGNPATERSDVTKEGFNGVGIFDILTPATSGDIVITFNGNVNSGITVFVYQILGNTVLPSFGSQNATQGGASSLTATIPTVESGQFIIAGAASAYATAPQAPTWSGTAGITASDDGITRNFIHEYAASTEFAGANGSKTVISTWPNASDLVLAAASYNPG